MGSRGTRHPAIFLRVQQDVMDGDGEGDGKKEARDPRRGESTVLAGVRAFSVSSICIFHVFSSGNA